jgi:hypothetical protein
MNSLKRDIASGLAMSVAVLLFALAWGSPFVSPRAVYADDAQPQMQAQPAPSLQAITPIAKPHPGKMARMHIN